MLDVVTNVCAIAWLSAESAPLSVNAVVPNGATGALERQRRDVVVLRPRSR